MTKSVIIRDTFCADAFLVTRKSSNVTITHYAGSGIVCTLKYSSDHAAKTIYGRCKKDKEFTEKIYFDFLAEEYGDDA